MQQFMSSQHALMCSFHDHPARRVYKTQEVMLVEKRVASILVVGGPLVSQSTARKSLTTEGVEEITHLLSNSYLFRKLNETNGTHTSRTTTISQPQTGPLQQIKDAAEALGAEEANKLVLQGVVGKVMGKG